MAIITLTTDLGLKDFTVSAIKGSIYSTLPTATIADITHLVPKFDIMQAAFILRNAYKHFPNGSIHIIGVMPYETIHNRHVAIEYKGHFFIGSDNGIFSMVFDEKPNTIVELDLKSIASDNKFLKPTKDIFVQAACHIARGGTLEVLGNKKDSISERTMFRAIVNENNIRGTIIYIDNFGNAITNIPELTFKEAGRGRNFTLSFRVPGYDINEICESYAEVQPSERLAIFGPTGFLEIAINLGNASELLGLSTGDVITISFH